MRINIPGGTVGEGGPSLCLSCRHATIVRGVRLRDEIIECGMLMSRHSRIAFPVTFCTAYVNRQHPSIREMEDIAWVLRTDAKRKQVGFVHAKQLPPRDRYALPED